MWHFSRVPTESEPFEQTQIPYWTGPVKDPLTGRWITSHVMNQDFVAWVGQGRISDRQNEHLGTSDLGVRMLRRQLALDMAAVAEGRDPKGLVRDPERNRAIELPRRAELARGLTRDEWLADFAAFNRNSVGDYFSLLAGQPDEVRAAYEEAMGIDSVTLAGPTSR
jgi:5,5'-dehydrodivanillate O-demethylase